jgi:hypothetical protein
MTQTHNPRQGASPKGDFEHSLELEIEKLNTNKLTFGWINAPFTSWALSTVGIGFISFWYTGYSSCLSEEKQDNLAFSKIFTEIYQRRDKLNLLVNFGDSDTSLNDAITFLDPDLTYIFSDYKGKKLLELTVNMNAITYRLDLLSPAVLESHTNNTQTPSSDASDFDVSNDYWTETYQRFADSSGKLSSTLLIDPRSVDKNPSPTKINQIMTQVRSIAKELKNAPEFATFLRQQNMIKSSCVTRALRR